MKNRLNKCLKSIKERGLNGLLISSPYNITYLTGFKPVEGHLLISPDKLVYFTNFIYEREAHKIKRWKVHCVKKNVFKEVAIIVRSLGIHTIGFEAKNMPFMEYKMFKQEFTSRNVNFIKTNDLIEKIRTIKTPKELQLIKKSIGITQEALSFAQEIVDERFSEKQLQIEIEKFLRIKGDNAIAFSPVVAFGKNSSLPHHEPTLTRLGTNKFFLIDLGAKYKGYCADLTRVFFLGKMPAYLKKLYDIVKRAQEAGIRKIRAGVKACEVDRTARNIINKKGLSKFFGHGLGHGVGLCVHERPYLNSLNEEILKENMVVTVEPALYLPGKFGVRLETMVVVKSHKGEVIDDHLNRYYKTWDSYPL